MARDPVKLAAEQQKYRQSPKGKAAAAARHARYIATPKGKAASAASRAVQLAKRELLAGRPRPDLCEVCHEPGRIEWDHNHTTGSFRGWLCGPCNRALGAAQDSVERLMLLVRYLS